METKCFRITGNRGFHITFPNGVTLSTQFGYGNYCGDYPESMNQSIEDVMERKPASSNDVEVAIWDKERTWITDKYIGEDEQVIGFVSMKEWLKIFDGARNYNETEK